MIKYISRRKFRIFAMDIESHNDSESIAKNETSCWLGSFIDENSKVILIFKIKNIFNFK